MKKILLSLLLLFLAVTIGSGIWLFSGSADLEESRFTSPTASLSLYDKNGDLLTQAYPSTGRIASKLSEIAPQSIQAFLSIEDKGFYSHGGIEPKRMLKAAWKNLSSLSFREGASTITQQLIKNTHLSNEKTLSRKLKEVRLALALERKHSKDEILEFYLNTVYFGHDLFGIGDAASYFFDKSPSDLTLAEGAMLAGLLQSPNRYSPFINPDRCLARRSVVLAAMEKDGAITREERTKAEEEPLPTKAHGKRDSLSFVLSELDRFTEEKGLSRLRDGKVYTSIDPTLQKKLEAIPHETDLTIAVSDNQTHKIIGYYSSVGEIRRLPGSIIKPLLVYAPCMEEGLVQPATPILDEKTDFGGYSPSNYNDAYHGYVSARQALARSLNVPAVKLLSSLGVEKGKAYLSKMGLTTKEDSLTLALGGMQDGFTLTELVNAYSVFSNEGYYCPSSPLVSFTLGKKEVLCQTEYRKNRVFSEETVSLMNSILQDTVKIGTAKKLQFSTFTPMAKTGTVGSEAGNTDAWTIVYTADHTVGVWLGNADYSLHTETGGDKACRIAREVLSVLTADHTPSTLPVADGVAYCTLDKLTYEKDHQLLKADPLSPKKEQIREIFNKKYLPTGTSDYFSHPRIPSAQISCNASGVTITLPHADYYDFRVERVDIQGYTKIYSNIQDYTIKDIDVFPGISYSYRVIPSYQGRDGVPVLLPTVRIPLQNETLPPSPPPTIPPSSPQEQVTTAPPILDKDWWTM